MAANLQPSLERLAQNIVLLKDAACRRMTKQLLTAGVNPTEVMEVCQQALVEIGKKYESGEYFIAGLIMAGDIMKQIIDMVLPLVEKPEKPPTRGRVLIGTVAGDIHDLGKNMAGAMLTTYGYEVKDLGVDVKPEVFLEEAKTFRPHIVGLSSLMTSGHSFLIQTVQLLRQRLPASDRPVIFISGAMIVENVRKRSGADYVVNNVAETVFLCERLMVSSSKNGLNSNLKDDAGPPIARAKAPPLDPAGDPQKASPPRRPPNPPASG
ncbi:MAG: cobalamin-dependent protein [Deltaproteobacteria bacterium]|jgi:methanogenic corrinoid protein MtbC1|nr:cobalamin-dependent protein [Deltaproteobacteria bacterium]